MILVEDQLALTAPPYFEWAQTLQQVLPADSYLIGVSFFRPISDHAFHDGCFRPYTCCAASAQAVDGQSLDGHCSLKNYGVHHEVLLRAYGVGDP